MTTNDVKIKTLWHVVRLKPSIFFAPWADDESRAKESFLCSRLFRVDLFAADFSSVHFLISSQWSLDIIKTIVKCDAPNRVPRWDFIVFFVVVVLFSIKLLPWPPRNLPGLKCKHCWHNFFVHQPKSIKVHNMFTSSLINERSNHVYYN